MVLGLHLLSLAPGKVARSPPSPPGTRSLPGAFFISHLLQNALHVLFEDRIARHDRHRDLQRIDRNSRKDRDLQFCQVFSRTNEHLGHRIGRG